MPPRSGRLGAAIVFAVAIGVIARASFLLWESPWTPHHADEVFLPLESLALWEGVTPRELGWPASTTRVLLSAAAAADWGLHHVVEAARAGTGGAHVALEQISRWIGSRYVDPTPMFRLGRAISLATAVLQLLLTVWAIRRWTREGTAIVAGTLAVALCPVAVSYSQYVLADVQAILCATLIVGLAARPTPRRVVVMGAIAGAAIASKYHFGLWLLTPLLCIWITMRAPTGTRVRLSLAAGAACAAVVLAFVPWMWIHPLLTVKEFLATVAGKVHGYESIGTTAAHAMLLLGASGIVAWLGGLAGILALRQDWRAYTPIALPVVAGAVVLVNSAIVFDRYALVLLPGMMLLAADGWSRVIGLLAHRSAAAAAVVATVVGGAALFTLVGAQRATGETDVDVQATAWIKAHLPRGTRIAVHDESIAPLPRTADQLRACIARLESPDAYAHKWEVLGSPAPSGPAHPMEATLLNDERFYQYWCRRELLVTRDAGFHVVPYNRDVRFWSTLERDAIAEFRTGGTAKTGGLDAIVVDRPIDVGLPPAQIVRNARGQRVIYVRSPPGVNP